MKLLFDRNLSPRLVDRVSVCIPLASHVARAGLERASDEAAWRFARDHLTLTYALVTEVHDPGVTYDLLVDSPVQMLSREEPAAADARELVPLRIQLAQLTREDRV